MYIYIFLLFPIFSSYRHPQQLLAVTTHHFGRYVRRRPRGGTLRRRLQQRSTGLHFGHGQDDLDGTTTMAASKQRLGLSWGLFIH